MTLPSQPDRPVPAPRSTPQAPTAIAVDRSEPLDQLRDRVREAGATVSESIGHTVALLHRHDLAPRKAARELTIIAALTAGAAALAAASAATAGGDIVDTLATAALAPDGNTRVDALIFFVLWVTAALIGPVYFGATINRLILRPRRLNREAAHDPVRQSFTTREQGHGALTARPALPLYAAHVEGDESAGTIAVKLLRYGPDEPEGRARIIFEAITPHEPLERAQRTVQMIEAEAVHLEHAAIERRAARELEAVNRDATALDVASTVALLRPSHVTRKRTDR